MPKTTLNEIVSDPVRRAGLEARFWPKVDRKGDNECWPWASKALAHFGYGRLFLATNSGQARAHRVAYALRHGSVPDHLQVCHRCDNPPCCNPNHLFLGTAVDNMKDAARKGHTSPPPHSFGEKHHNAKFDAKSALSIANDRRSARIIAAQYGVSEMTIYRIRKGLTWKNLERPR